MKINGQSVTRPSEVVLVLPREGEPVVFRAIALPDMDEFEKLCPEPKAPGVLTKDGWIPNPNDAGYKAIVANHNAQRMAYMIVHSLAPSNIEWDTVTLDNPGSWVCWRDDMKAAGITAIELQRVFQLVLDANCLNEAKIEKARELFLLGKAAASDTASSQSSAPANSQSGEPAAA